MAKIYGNTLTTPLNPNTSTDQTYNPESENAQSGKAVAEAVKNVVRTDETGEQTIPHIISTKGKFNDLSVYYDGDYVPVISQEEAEYVINAAIGDVETALENIIAKYGMGGETV